MQRLSDTGGSQLLCRSTNCPIFERFLLVSAKMTYIDPQAWLSDVLARLPDMAVSLCMICCHGIGAPQQN